MKHCNKIHIHGILDKCEEKLSKSDKPYLEIIVDCQHDEYGSVRVLCFILDKKNIEYFQTKFTRGDEVRLSGNLQQYIGRGKETRTTFKIYIIKSAQLKEYKTTFIMVGEVVSLDDDGSLLLLIKTPKGEKYEAKEDTFKIHLPREILLEADQTPVPGQTVSAKGYIMQTEDEYGDTTGPQRPVVKELKIT